MYPLTSIRVVRFSSVNTRAGRTGRAFANFACAAAAIVAIGVAVSAEAVAKVSVTNRDEKDHKITIVEGAVKQDHVLTPNQVFESDCTNGCILRLNDSEDDE